MSKKEKAIEKLRQSQKTIRFEDVDSILCGLGYDRRMKGSHAV